MAEVEARGAESPLEYPDALGQHDVSEEGLPCVDAPLEQHYHPRVLVFVVLPLDEEGRLRLKDGVGSARRPNAP